MSNNSTNYYPISFSSPSQSDNIINYSYSPSPDLKNLKSYESNKYQNYDTFNTIPIPSELETKKDFNPISFVENVNKTNFITHFYKKPKDIMTYDEIKAQNDDFTFCNLTPIPSPPTIKQYLPEFRNENICKIEKTTQYPKFSRNIYNKNKTNLSSICQLKNYGPSISTQTQKEIPFDKCKQNEKSNNKIYNPKIINNCYKGIDDFCKKKENRNFNPTEFREIITRNKSIDQVYQHQPIYDLQMEYISEKKKGQKNKFYQRNNILNSNSYISKYNVTKPKCSNYINHEIKRYNQRNKKEFQTQHKQTENYNINSQKQYLKVNTLLDKVNFVDELNEEELEKLYCNYKHKTDIGLLDGF